MRERSRLLTKTIYPHLGKLAKELGCSEFHLRAVLRGRRRPGPELAAKLKKRGIKTEKLRDPLEWWA